MSDQSFNMSDNELHILSISAIRIGGRHRKDLGDLHDLAASIEKGLLQLIGVTPCIELIQSPTSSPIFAEA